MIKILFKDYHREFKHEREVMEYLDKISTGKPIVFQWFEHREGSLEQMDYFTYHKGHLSETYNTRS